MHPKAGATVKRLQEPSPNFMQISFKVQQRAEPFTPPVGVLEQPKGYRESAGVSFPAIASNILNII